MIRIFKMRLLDFLLLLVQYAFARQVNPTMLNQLGINYDSFIVSNTTGCCGCSFEDTKYMDSVCGGQSAFMTLVQNLMMSRCDIADPCRRLGRDDIPNEWYDFIVVGAGVAGPIIARRLSDNAWNRVLLIEAGPEEPTMTAIPGLAWNAIQSSLDWKYKTEPTRPHPTACLDTGGKCNVPRGRMISGTGGMHGMMYYRGHPEIYNKWAREGNVGWSYDEIEHYFQRVEDPVDPSMLSSHARTVPNGPVKIQHYSHRPQFVSVLLDSAAELGYRTYGLKEYTQTGFMVAPMTVEKGLRASTPKAYLRPVYNRNNLRVLTNAQVLRVLINDYDMKAYGVELIDKYGQRRIIKCNKEVILTAGAMGSPQILLNSGIGPREQLTKLGIRTYKDLPVGQYFINHVSIAVPMSIRDTSVETMTMQSVNEYLESRTGDLASTGLTQVTAFLESNYTIPGIPDLQVFFDGFSSYCPKTGMPNECTNGIKEPCPNRRKIVARPTVVIPESRGTLELRSANPLDLPLMYPNYFTHEKDMKVLIEGIKKVLKLIETPSMKKWDLQLETLHHPLCTKFHFGTDAYWECYIRAKTGPENHQAGTCKMGPATDADAVVDPQLRVHGVPNIRVADPSIFPYLPNANPIAAIMMWGISPTSIHEPASGYDQSFVDICLSRKYRTLLVAQCSLIVNNEYPKDRTNEIISSKREFDFVIVGGGTAGSVLANRLTEISNWDVLLIEAGEDPSELSDIPGLILLIQGTAEDYSYDIEPQEGFCQSMKNNNCKWGKGKVLGGSSVINAMLYVRGNDRDYDEWEHLGNEGWSYEEVLPYFKKSIDCPQEYIDKWEDKYCAKGGPLNIRSFNYSETKIQEIFTNAARELGIPILEAFYEDNYIGYGKALGTIDMSRRINAAKAFLSPIKDRKNLYVIKSARVDKVLMNDNRAGGVRVTLKNGEQIDVTASKEVILSAGTIATPQILMLSGIGPANHLREIGIPLVTDLPVGKNLQDHVIWLGLQLAYINHTYAQPSPTHIMDIVYNYLMRGTGELGTIGGVEHVAFLNLSDPQSKYPEIQILYTHVPRWQVDKLQMLLKAFDVLDELIENMSKVIMETDIVFMCPALLRPKSTGEIKLRSSDPADQVKIYANYFADQSDRKTLLKSLDFVKSLVKTKTFQKNGITLRHYDIPNCRNTEPDTMEYWDCNLSNTAGTFYHPVGTAKMGPSGDPTAVVDARLKMTNALATVRAALQANAIELGIGKLSFIPILISAITYFNYHLIDPENQPRVTKKLLKEYDFVVVGGGSAGSVVVNRLTENPEWNVLLLEAGGHETWVSDVPALSFFLQDSKMDWKYRTQPQDSACQAMKDKRCRWPRGKALGGSSVLNSMLYVRGNRRDFDQWESFGNPGWGYEDVLPYFKKSQDQRNPYLARNTKYHSTGGYLTVQDCPYNTPLGPAFLQAAEEMGFDIVDVNGEQQTGFGFFQYTMRRGTRCSAAKAFIRPIKFRKNFHLSLWSHVTRVLIDPSTKKAYGIEFIRNGRVETVFAKKEVILSAGAINTPQLLMLSGIGARNHLEELGIPVIQDSPGVGQNLQDHIALGGQIFLIDDDISVKFNNIININSVWKYTITENGPLTSSIGLEVVGFLSTKYANQTDDWPDVEFMLCSSAITIGGKEVKNALGLTDDFYNDVYGSITNRNSFTIFPMILRPKSRGYIKLKSKHPRDYPLIYHNYLTNPDDVNVLREGVKAAIAFAETSSMKRLGARFHSKPFPNCKHLPMFTDEYWECAIRQFTMTIYHYSCTSKMGPRSDPMAVVDPSLKVYGVEGLRVIDASIMPTVTSSNTNAPVIMIGEKGSDLIKKDWLVVMEIEADFMFTALLRPKRTSEIKLRSTDSANQVKIFANYFADQKDRKLHLISSDFVKLLVKTKTFQKNGITLRN
ncbi:hypothetical protein V1478_013693 [Vespula squamosa]|uniref:Glucose-methanol-choline oxidoreductase N-terminal domain-containing protein n=1 Tax=Vespula squamosa TaxID=30214 RepID=A0ABD2A6Q9_VESSQ